MADLPRTLAWPLRLTDTGQYASVVFDSIPEKCQAVDLVAETPLGGVRAMPWFGRPDLAFGQGPDGTREAAEALDAAISKHEPRVEGEVEVLYDDTEIDVDVRGVTDSTSQDDAS